MHTQARVHANTHIHAHTLMHGSKVNSQKQVRRNGCLRLITCNCLRLVIRVFYSPWGGSDPVRAAMSGHSSRCPHGFPQTFSSAHKSNGQCVFSSPACVNTFTPSPLRLPSAVPPLVSTRRANKHIPSRLIWCQH